MLELVDQPTPEPDPGEVLIRMAFSGVNPTDVKSRSGNGSPPPYGWQIPGQDGAGVIEATGQGVDSTLVGERVWVWEAAGQRAWGTTAEYTLVPAAAAGASHVINYKQQDVVAEVRKIAPHGVDTIVEVAADQNASVDAQVIGHAGVVSVYSVRGTGELTLPAMQLMAPNARWQFVTIYHVPTAAKAQAVQDVATAATQGGIRVGADAGLPLHYYPLVEAADAHAAVENFAVGKVLISAARQ